MFVSDDLDRRMTDTVISPWIGTMIRFGNTDLVAPDDIHSALDFLLYTEQVNDECRPAVGFKQFLDADLIDDRFG